MLHQELTKTIIGCAYTVHKTKLKSLEYALHKIGRRLKVEMVSYQ